MHSKIRVASPSYRGASTSIVIIDARRHVNIMHGGDTRVVAKAVRCMLYVRSDEGGRHKCGAVCPH